MSRQRESQRRNPIATRARTLTTRALRMRDILPQPCEQCQTTKRVEAHHDDYTKPYQIRWFCSTHHKALHQLYRLKGVIIPGEVPKHRPPPKPKPQPKLNPLTVTEFARMGGYALARKRSQEQRIAAAKHAIGVRWANKQPAAEDHDNPSAILKVSR